MQWSPCSKYLCVNIWSADEFTSLEIMNTDLETVHAWREWEEDWLVAVWAADSSLLCVQYTSDPKPHYYVQSCWNPSVQQSDNAQAAHLRELLAYFHATAEDMSDLKWGPCTAAAVITKLKRPIPSASQGSRKALPAMTHKLYVLESGQGFTSMALAWQDDGQVTWSPAGDRLLLDCEASLRLVTTGCVLVVVMDETPVQWNLELRLAVFASDGTQIAVACPCHNASLRLHSAGNGEMLFSFDNIVVRDPMNGSWDLSFSENSDQLILLGWHVLIISFGLESGPRCARSQQLCNAIAAIGSQATC